MQYVGIDWGTRRAAWCSFDERGEMVEGTVSADQDGLARLVHTLGPDAYGCVEMMSGAVWVREQLQSLRLAVRGRRRAQGQGDRSVGVQDRQGRRSGAGPAGRP
jgi:hypothetical protein